MLPNLVQIYKKLPKGKLPKGNFYVLLTGILFCPEELPYHLHLIPTSMSHAEEALICCWPEPMVERSK